MIICAYVNKPRILKAIGCIIKAVKPVKVEVEAPERSSHVDTRTKKEADRIADIKGAGRKEKKGAVRRCYAGLSPSRWKNQGARTKFSRRHPYKKKKQTAMRI